MFFKGRPLKDENKISDFSNNNLKNFILEFTNGDVILYMPFDLPKQENQEGIENTIISNESGLNDNNVSLF